MTTATAAIDIFGVYQHAYMGVRAKYQHPDEPILPIKYGGAFLEPLSPRGWDRETYAAYFDEVTRLYRWYRAALDYGAKHRKTAEDRAAYEQACDRYAVAGKEMRFEGDPEPALF